MRPRYSLLAMLILALAVQAPLAAKDKGRDGGRGGGGDQMTAAEAGAAARRQTGGRVLAIKPADGGYRVKVLTPAGEVRQVFVRGSGR